VNERTIELQKEKERAEKLAQTDMLTGLNNRRAFYNPGTLQLKNATRNKLPTSVIVMDIDKFKNINDTYGYAYGDKVIKKFADTILGTIRESDVAGRIGGEEFAVLLSQTNIKSAYKVAEKLQKNIKKQFVEADGLCIKFTSSFGVAEKLDDFNSLESLIREADIALYEAKNSGRDKIILSEHNSLNP